MNEKSEIKKERHTMRKAAIVVLAGMMIAGAASAVDEHSGHGANVQKKTKVVPQETCPVMGGQVNKAIYADHEGRRIFGCCPGCVVPIQKNFAKYAKKVEAAGETVAKIQATCPVMGGKINKKQYVDVEGKRIYVCCPGCIGKIKADPSKYINKLESDGVVLDVAPKPEKDEGKGVDRMWHKKR